MPVLGRPNLVVWSHTQALKIAFQKTRAIGVDVLRAGARVRAGARRDVILSAGAIASPKLLLLSGVGPAAALRASGIPVVRDLAGVGSNLQDHLRVSVRWHSKDLVVRSRRVVTSRGMRAGAVHVRNGRIIGILDIDDVPPGCPVDDADEQVVMPGLVDSSVHVGGPGRTSPDDFETATRAAAAGGVTTIVAMPFQLTPVTTTAAALETTCRAAEGHCFVDVGFWGGVVPGNENDLAALFEAGVPGFACALESSAIGGARAVSEIDLRRALPALTAIGAPLLAHAELPGPIGRPGGASVMDGSDPGPGTGIEAVCKLPREPPEDRRERGHRAPDPALPGIPAAHSHLSPVVV